MTLSGNLGFVPLDEVLRLLTRAGNDGMVQITNTTASGRIFVAGKGISLATTLADFGLREHLASSGYISLDDLDSVENGTHSLGEFFTEGSEGLALLREMTVESIYQLDADDADFQVMKDQTTPFSSPTTFDLESILSDSRDRRDEWSKVRKTIDDLDATLRIQRDLGRDSVELNKESWRLVAEIGGGASVTELARNLGTTEFAVAKVAAAMVGSGLVSLEPDESTSYRPSEPTGYVPVESVSYQEPERQQEVTPSYLDPAASEELVEEPVSSPAAEAANESSWWEKSETEDSDAVAESTSEPASGMVIDDDEAGTGKVSIDEPAGDVSTEDDTEAFLEKVFSDLGEEHDTTEDGHGLMRRRRMGSILRELGED